MTAFILVFMFLYSQEEFKINLSLKDLLKNKKKNMDQVNYDKMQYDIQEINILRGSSDQGQVSVFRHWKIEIDVNNILSGSQKTSPRIRLNLFQKIFLDFFGFIYVFICVSNSAKTNGALLKMLAKMSWQKMTKKITSKSKLMNMNFCFMLYQKYLKDETGSK